MIVITISDEAVAKIKDMLAAEETPDMFLRVGVNSGGCSGLSYGMGFDDEEQEGDELHTFHGLKVAVDRDSLPYLNGVKIDFKESAMGGGFTIDNPLATATCGCGSSFRTANNAGNPGDC